MGDDTVDVHAAERLVRGVADMRRGSRIYAALMSRADLLRDVWGTDCERGNTVDIVIRSPRKRLGARVDRIETVRGVGYRLR